MWWLLLLLMPDPTLTLIIVNSAIDYERDTSGLLRAWENLQRQKRSAQDLNNFGRYIQFPSEHELLELTSPNDIDGLQISQISSKWSLASR